MRILLLCLLTMIVTAAEGGLSMRPAVVLLQGIKPGTPFAFPADGGTGYTIVNNGEQALQIDCTALTPQRDFAAYECGYEPPPDGSWFSVTPNLFDIPPGEEVHANFLAEIPDDPAYYNRHWMVYVECGPPSRSALGAVIRLRARIMLETRPAARIPDQRPSGLVHVAPSLIAMQKQADGSWNGVTEVGNGSDRTATYDLIRVSDIWPDDVSKAHRFFPDPREAVMPERWAASNTEQFTIDPGKWKPLQLSASPPTITSPREEIIFIARRAAAPDDAITTKVINDVTYDHMELLRLVYLP